MANYFCNSQLIQSDSQCEVYSFGMVENFYKILEINNLNEMILDFDYNVS